MTSDLKRKPEDVPSSRFYKKQKQWINLKRPLEYIDEVRLPKKQKQGYTEVMLSPELTDLLRNSKITSAVDNIWRQDRQMVLYSASQKGRYDFYRENMTEKSEEDVDEMEMD